MKGYLFLLLVGVLILCTLSSTPSVNIATIKKLALQVANGNQVLADLTAAQAILESNLEGKPSMLAFKYNNLFGIKGSGTAGSVSLPTTEYIKGKKESVMQQFAANTNIEDSLQQHNNLFKNGTSDNPLRYTKVLKATTFEEAAQAVQAAGYATDPNYSKELIAVYNRDLK